MTKRPIWLFIILANFAGHCSPGGEQRSDSKGNSASSDDVQTQFEQGRQGGNESEVPVYPDDASNPDGESPGNEDGGIDDSDGPSKTAYQMDGKWVTNCSSLVLPTSQGSLNRGIKRLLTIENRQVELMIHYYTSADCGEEMGVSQGIITQDQADPPEINATETVYHLKTNLDRLSLRPTSRIGARDLNRAEFCGSASWATNMAKNLLGTTCVIGDTTIAPLLGESATLTVRVNDQSLVIDPPPRQLLYRTFWSTP